jgi:hypothetical protein
MVTIIGSAAAVHDAPAGAYCIQGSTGAGVAAKVQSCSVGGGIAVVVHDATDTS